MNIIYKVTNTITNDIYIGATSQNINDRIIQHHAEAKRQTGHKFHNAILTYGMENFEWDQIDTASTLNELANKEVLYIYEYNSAINGYNQNRGGGFKKNVYQYDEHGMLTNIYCDLKSAATAVNATTKSISKACLNATKSCKGYYWSYNHTEFFAPTYDLRKKRVNQYSLQNDLVATYNSVSEASKLTEINKSSIAKCCRGERKNAGNFIWAYV